MQPVEGERQRPLRHREARFLGPRQEVGDVGSEPHVCVARAPDAEGAVARLHLEHALDGGLHARLHRLVLAEAGDAREIVEVDERHGAARGLLGAAVGIAIERQQQADEVETNRRADAQADTGLLGQHVGQEVGRDRHLAAVGVERRHRHAPDVAGWRLHGIGERSCERNAVGTGDADLVVHETDLLRLEHHALEFPLAGLQRDLACGDDRCLALDVGTWDRDERYLVGAGLAVDVVQVDDEANLVAERHEARTGNEERHRLAHDDVRLGGAELIGAPGDGCQANRAVEGWQVELDDRVAFVVRPHETRKQRDRLLDLRAALDLHGRVGVAVAALAQLAALGLHAVDKAAVEITDFGRKLPLRVKELLRVWRLEPGEVQDTNVDCTDDDAGVLAGREAVDLDRHLKSAAARQLVGSCECDFQRAALAVDLDPLQA